MLALFTDFIAGGAVDGLIVGALGENLRELITGIIGPIFLTIVGIVALVFLFQRQFMQFLMFIIIAVLVAALIYVPEFIQNLGTGAGNEITWD